MSETQSDLTTADPQAAGARPRGPDAAEPGPAVAGKRLRVPWTRLVVLAVVIFAASAIWVTNAFLSRGLTETTRSRAELRLALYSGNIISELKRTAVVPLLLARDPALIEALSSGNFSTTSQRLISAQGEIGAAAIQLIDMQGRTVAATNRNIIGTSHVAAAYFVDAQRSSDTIFTVSKGAAGGFEFIYSRAVRSEGKILGVIIVSAELTKFERGWAGISDAVAVLDSTGTIILTSEPRWRGLTLEEALAARSAPSVLTRALQATADLANQPPDAYLKGEAVMRTEARVPFRGWRMVSFTTYDSVRERVNAVLALEMMAFAVLLAAGFWWASRRARQQSAMARRESAELRMLNARLSREIAEREKAQKDLATAEQTLAQSSKLAALGEMSAAVSHELNQPLAAMKTYLAGARLLLQRKRPEEALSSFQRIDDLIERMGAITRQLKSYARKGGDALEPVDMRVCVSSALSMMEPQLRTRTVRINRTLPRGPIMVMADRVRLEQVIINLLRNALDATKGSSSPQIDILLTAGETAVLSVRDNGHGIEDMENLFEPFYTTKKPGEGVGLGLAISSGIVKDLGGRLTARNAPGSGAVFEVQLPLLGKATEAAE